ncbi:MAG: hypothetical protein O3A25_06670 [Acidobacteria bacterium]|nr:hypothetical protein [Acidobacteriota bacterium]
MSQTRTRKRKKTPKRVLALPDLEQAKSAVLASLTSASGQRTYDHAIREFVGWYCSEPRLAFNRTVVLRYRTHLEQQHYARSSPSCTAPTPNDADAGNPRSTIFDTTSELLNIDTSPDTTLTVIPADFKED